MAALDGSDSQSKQQAPVNNQDVELAFRMGVKLMSEGNGLQSVKDAIEQSEDPAMVIGQFLAQIMGVLAQKLKDEVNMDPRVFLAKGGWLDLILDYIEKKLGYPAEFSDQIYAQVVEVIKAAAQKPPSPNGVMGGGQAEQPAQGPAPGGLGG